MSAESEEECVDSPFPTNGVGRYLASVMLFTVELSYSFSYKHCILNVHWGRGSPYAINGATDNFVNAEMVDKVAFAMRNGLMRVTCERDVCERE